MSFSYHEGQMLDLKSSWFLFFAFVLAAQHFSIATQATPAVDLSYALPAGEHSHLPRLTRGNDGRLYLSWVEKRGNGSVLQFSKLEDGRWNAPRKIAQGDNWFVNWADFPSLEVDGEFMSAHWLQKSGLGKFDYDVRISLSDDGGENWAPSFVPHKDNTSAEYGFVSLVILDQNRLFATWLDGRNTKGHGIGHIHGGMVTLRAGIFSRKGEELVSWELDDSVCDCCQTAAIKTNGGVLVAYRDRSHSEIRDTYTTRWDGGVWSDPKAVSKENWKINGCPVNGPVLSTQGGATAIAWFTMSENRPQVKLALSTDMGKTFGNPIIVSDNHNLGRLGLSVIEDGTTAVSWVEHTNKAAHIKLAHYSEKGELLAKQLVTSIDPSRSSGIPVMASEGRRVYLAWTRVEESSQVEMASFDL